MSDGRGHERLREEIKRVLSSVAEFEARDPVIRAAFPTVMDVRLSPDARYAQVFVALDAAEADKEAVMAAFRHDRGFFRSELAHRLNLRYTPELRFVLDETIERAQRLERLFDETRDGQAPA